VKTIDVQQSFDISGAGADLGCFDPTDLCGRDVLQLNRSIIQSETGLLAKLSQLVPQAAPTNSWALVCGHRTSWST
jgi:hypothetical protein